MPLSQGLFHHTPQPTDPPPPTPARAVRLAIYGDSYTVGRGTSDPCLRWSTLLCHRHGWEELNEGINGLGFVRKRQDRNGHSEGVERIVAAKADVVLVSLGTNDTVMFDDHADAIAANITADLRDLSTGLPGSRILVMEPFWAYTEIPPKVATIRFWLKQAAEAIGVDYIENTSTSFAGRPDLLAPDGLHANDIGHRLIAQFMEEALTTRGVLPQAGSGR
ncbi:SGNH/GDSL hydrolase family protein [Nonomuraea sp. NPDC050556]|uniref:SGNH/GDSL hydrolase family protein n=1 Tax=Nonomuraea sp. NPDC050556 TaxID=3364369 RepID=UPI0037A66E32